MSRRNVRFAHKAAYLPMGIGARPRPYLQCTLTANGQRISLPALVDSGADGCRFPIDVGYELGFSFDEGDWETSSGFGGLSQVYRRTVIITVAKRSFPIEARFDSGAQDWQAVIGREGFFSTFFVGFEEPQRALYLQPLL